MKKRNDNMKVKRKEEVLEGLFFDKEISKLYLKISPYCDGIILPIASLNPNPAIIKEVQPAIPIIVIKNLFL